MKTSTPYIENQEEKKIFNPFPGLRPFTISESHLFFGREGQSDEVLSKLSDNKFVAVIGASGSGKSSLIYCGLIPILHGGFITSSGNKWKMIVARPGNSPIENLANSLELEASVLCPRALIGTIATFNPVDVRSLKALPDFKNWQRKTFGHEIIMALKSLKGKNQR